MQLNSLEELDASLDQDIGGVLADHGVPGAAVTVIHSGRAFVKLHGVKRLGFPEKVGPLTAFNIASTSKAFVSCAAAALVAEGRLAWDDPIRRYVPEFELYDPWVTEHATLRDLSGNRLGLPRNGLTEYGFNPDVPVETVFRRLKHTQPISGFREKFTYVNPGHTAVGLALGRVTGQSFLQILREKVLYPLGMMNTSGGVAARSELKDFAGWHCGVGDRTQAIAPVYSDNYLGSGGMWTCAADAAKWLQLHLFGGVVEGRRIVAEEALRETHSPQVVVRPNDIAPWIGVPGTCFAAYGLGWAMSEWEGEWVIGHSGSDLGVAAQIGFAPARGIGVAVYLNKNCPAALELKLMVLQRLLGRQPRNWREIIADRTLPSTHLSSPRVERDPEPGIVPTLALSAYAGRYFHPGSGYITVRESDTGLDLELDAGQIYNADLKPLGGHRFLFLARHPANRDSMRVSVEFVVEQGRPTRVIIPEVQEFEAVP